MKHLKGLYWSTLVAVLLTVLLTTCAVLHTSKTYAPLGLLAASLERFQPPIEYSEWFYEVKECLDLEKGKFNSIKWQKSPFIRDLWTLQRLAGFHNGDYITIATDKLDEKWLIKHELIHFILTKNGTDPDPNHLNPAYGACI